MDDETSVGKLMNRSEQASNSIHRDRGERA